MASRVSSPVFVGRADELGELVAAMAGARAGTPGLVLVGGEPGVGKSRLVAELTACASADGNRILAGQCVGFDEATIPLLPVIDALRGLDDGAQDLLDTRLVPVSAAGRRRAARHDPRHHRRTALPVPGRQTRAPARAAAQLRDVAAASPRRQHRHRAVAWARRYRLHPALHPRRP